MDVQKHGQFSVIPSRTMYDTRLDSDDRDVLNCIGLYANKNGWCYPKQKTIGAILGKKQSFVSTRISRLAECGYLLIVPQFNEDTGARIFNKYRIIHDTELPKEFDRSELDPILKQARIEMTPISDDTESEMTPILGQAQPKIAEQLIERVKETNGAHPAPAVPPQQGKSAEKDEFLIPSGILVFREVRRRFPPRETWDMIDAAVGRDPNDLELWRQILVKVAALGWNRNGVETPLEFFKRRELPKNRKGGVVAESKLDQMRRVILGDDNGEQGTDLENDVNIIDGISIIAA